MSSYEIWLCKGCGWSMSTEDEPKNDSNKCSACLDPRLQKTFKVATYKCENCGNVKRTANILCAGCNRPHICAGCVIYCRLEVFTTCKYHR